VKNPMGKPLPLTLLGVTNPCHLHDPNGMSQPDDITKTLSKHGVHFATVVVPPLLLRIGRTRQPLLTILPSALVNAPLPKPPLPPRCGLVLDLIGTRADTGQYGIHLRGRPSQNNHNLTDTRVDRTCATLPRHKVRYAATTSREVINNWEYHSPPA
jgi:hypothetical protein